MKISAASPEQAAFDAQTCLVLARFTDDGDSVVVPENQSLSARLSALSESGVLSSKSGSAYFMAAPDGPFGGILVLGLGEKGEFAHETLRRSAGASAGILSEEKITKLRVLCTQGSPLPWEALVEGIALAQYDYDAFKNVENGASKRVEEITLLSERAESEVLAACERAVHVIEAVTWARDLANAPANELTPVALADAATKMAEDSGVSCTVLDEAAMLQEGMGALLSVSKGSDEEARLIILEYRHPEASETIALVGKGITFDTGGISLKPPDKMHEMKYDMCGAATVLGTMHAVYRLKPRINVVCTVPAAENKTGSEATRPGDIVRARNGKTIEIHNTDAEGRLVLADALSYTLDTYKPEAVVDVATLTGACIVALGHYAAALMGNDADLERELTAAAVESGERVWPFPLWDDYTRLIEGTHADLCNIGPAREAGSIMGGCFLKEFVGDTPWAHLDIAGTAWGVNNISYLNPDHATGYGVRLLTEWIRARAQA